MSCNFSDRFFVMNCGLCIFWFIVSKKTLLLTLTYPLFIQKCLGPQQHRYSSPHPYDGLDMK